MRPTIYHPTKDRMMPHGDAILCCSSATPIVQIMLDEKCWHAVTLAVAPVPAGLGVEKTMTLSPLGIRRNVSGITHNPGATAAGMHCVLICAYHSPSKTPCGTWIYNCTYILCDRFVHYNGRSKEKEKNKNMADPASIWCWIFDGQEYPGWAGSMAANSGSPQPAAPSRSHLPPPSSQMKKKLIKERKINKELGYVGASGSILMGVSWVGGGKWEVVAGRVRTRFGGFVGTH